MRRSAPDSRAYRHRKCNGQTVVGGDDFYYVAQIFAHPKRTYCASCSDYFPMNQFCWSDTDERITHYYARYAAKFTAAETIINQSSIYLSILCTTALIMGVIGFTLGCIMVMWIVGIVGFVVGAGLGGYVTNAVLDKIVKQTSMRALGVSDHTMLE